MVFVFVVFTKQTMGKYILINLAQDQSKGKYEFQNHPRCEYIVQHGHNIKPVFYYFQFLFS